MNAVISTVPLLLLGVIRFVSVKAVNYQEHVSEYGVQWNFFLTLAMVKVGGPLPATTTGQVVVVCFHNLGPIIPNE